MRVEILSKKSPYHEGTKDTKTPIFRLKTVDLFEVGVAPAVQQGVDADRRHGRDVTGREDGDCSLLLGLGHSIRLLKIYKLFRKDNFFDNFSSRRKNK